MISTLSPPSLHAPAPAHGRHHWWSPPDPSAPLPDSYKWTALFVSTLPLLKSLPAQGLVVTKQPALTTEFVLFNTISGPFSNILAREDATILAALLANLPALLTPATY